MGFVDGHAALVKLQNLWTYYWHRTGIRPSNRRLRREVVFMKRFIQMLDSFGFSFAGNL